MFIQEKGDGMNIGIIGVSGYSGMVLYALLREHPAINKIFLYGNKEQLESRRLAEIVPAFGSSEAVIQPFDAQTVQQEVNCLFCATPAGITSELMPEFLEKKFPVIDLSGDFRLKESKQYEKWYQQKNRQLPSSEQITYGLADFVETYHSYVANPGCYATATLLSLAPLAQAQILQKDSVIVDAKSGVSGAGKKLTESSHFSFINENAWVYKPNQHQHIPEITQQLQQWDPELTTIQFTTTLLPITRGIMVTSYVKLTKDYTQEEIEELFTTCYQDTPFVRYRGATLPMIKEVVGSNYCDIGTVWNEETQVLTIVSVIDNLVKGAAGQAVQNFNKMFGFDEMSGLPLFPQFP